MGLETGDFIDDLIESNPTGLDVKSQGDDHLRLIKHILKSTFPSFTGAFPFAHDFMPSPLTVGSFIRALSATHFEQRTAAQVRNDIGADNASNLVTGTLPEARLPALTIPFRFADGVFNAPGIAFDSQPTLGFWKRGVGDIGIAASSELIGRFFRSSSTHLFQVGEGTKSAIMDVNGAAGTVRTLRHLTNGVLRFEIALNSSAEAGADAGSNIELKGYSDAGAVLWTSSILRANGQQRQAGTGDLAQPDYSFQSDTDSGMSRVGTNILGMILGGENMAQWSLSAIPLRLSGRVSNDAVRLGLFDPTFATERGYIGYPTASDNTMIIRNILGTSFQFRNNNNHICTDIGSSTALDSFFAVTQGFRLTNVITPAALAAATHNYNPTGLGTCTVIRLSASGPQQLTGIQAIDAGRRITLVNIDSADTITLVHESASSTAANRFLTNGGLNVSLGDGDCIDIWYDTTSQRWRVFGT